MLKNLLIPLAMSRKKQCSLSRCSKDKTGNAREGTAAGRLMTHVPNNNNSGGDVYEHQKMGGIYRHDLGLTLLYFFIFPVCFKASIPVKCCDASSELEIL